VQDDTIRELRHQSIARDGLASRHVGMEAPPEAADAAPVRDRIGVGGGDENVAKLQLAARWSEQYAPEDGDTLDSALQRFRRVYNFIDSVSKLVDPDQE
jgi:hypothetical protein